MTWDKALTLIRVLNETVGTDPRMQKIHQVAAQKLHDLDPATLHFADEAEIEPEEE